MMNNNLVNDGYDGVIMNLITPDFLKLIDQEKYQPVDSVPMQGIDRY